MASILCKNGPQHTHYSVAESRACWTGTAPAPYSPPAPPVLLASAKQIEYVRTLGGDPLYAAKLTGGRDGQCSEYIKSLLAKKGSPVTAPTTTRQTRTKQQEFILGLLPMIPDGYFAVSPSGDDSDVTFVRVKRPSGGRLKGCTKIQTQHSEVLDDKFIYFPGSDTIWEKRGHAAEIEDTIKFLFTDYQGAAMRYARLIGKCCRCNKALTDARSRWYGIGPDCEQVFAWVIEQVDEIRGAYRP
jgi:hypothetical protein